MFGGVQHRASPFRRCGAPGGPGAGVVSVPGRRSRLGTREPFDCVILGAGPAGLTALTYLARFHRRAVAIGSSSHRPRLLLIERSYNLPGYPDGIPGVRLLQNLQAQAEENGGEVWEATARRVERADGGFAVHLEAGATLGARAVLLAMGVRDREPDIPGIGRHVGRFFRYCPVCDGYEHTDRRLGILGSGRVVARHALFLRTFSDQIAVFLHGSRPESLGPYQNVLRRRGLAVHPARVAAIMEREGDLESPHDGCGVRLEDGSEHPLDVLYGALGCDVRLDPVRHLDLKLDDEGYVLTGDDQQTSVPGIYAAGDLVSDINQISVAFGQATIAAVRIHHALDEEP
jgi:thioredoxin reductase (NADPH)